MKSAFEHNLYTVGHGTKKSEEFIYLLKRYNIEVLIDVRTYPYSRFHPQFCKDMLKTDLRLFGIRYLFLGKELGGRPKDRKLYENGKVNYSAIKQTQLFQSGIKQIEEMVQDGIKVTLMCSEADQNQCHRKHMIADEFIHLGIGVLHINKAGQLENHFDNHQSSLFI